MVPDLGSSRRKSDIQSQFLYWGLAGAFAEHQTKQHPILKDSDRGHCVRANSKGQSVDLWIRIQAWQWKVQNLWRKQ